MNLKKSLFKITDRFIQYSFTKQVVLVTSGILILEFITMILLHFIPALPLIAAAMLDCLTLLVLLSPAIWLSIRKETQYKAGRKKARDLLRERDTRFFTLANSGQALIWTAGKDQKADYFNQPWLSFTGNSREKLLGDGWMKDIHPEDLQQFNILYSASFEKQEAFNTEFRLLNASGEYHWMQNAGTPRYNSSGDFIGFIGHCLDISAKKQSDTYREMTREVLQVINETDNLQDLIQKVILVLKQSTDFENVHFRFKNAPYFSHELFNGTNLFVISDENAKPDNYYPEEIKNVCLCRMIINGKRNPSLPEFTPGGSWWSNNFHSLRKTEDCPANGMCLNEHYIRDENTTVALIPIASKDKVFGLMQVTSDKKDRLTNVVVEKLEGIASHIGAAVLHKLDQEVLKEKDKILNRAQQIAHLGSWSLDLRNNRLTWSDEVYRIFGLQPQEFAATYEGFLDAIHPDDREMVNSAYSDSITENKTVMKLNTGLYAKIRMS